MKFIQRLGGPCCEYPLFKIKLSQGSENLVDLSVNESYKNHAVVITPKEGYSANKMSVTVNGKTITPENGVFSFIMPSGNVNVVVTDTRNDLEKVQDLLTFAGYTENQKLFTQGRYIWMEGSNEDSEIKAIILADDTNYLKTSVLGNIGEEVVSQLVSSRIIQNAGQYLTSLRTLDSYEYYMPESVNSFIGEEIGVIEDPYQGFEYVDLGLPSGTKWATMNVGATSNTSSSNLYSYGHGDTIYTNNINNSRPSSYNGNEDPLDLSKDSARQTMGGIWHMPTQEQMEELIANTDVSYSDNIVTLTSKSDNSKYININMNDTSSSFWKFERGHWIEYIMRGLYLLSSTRNIALEIQESVSNTTLEEIATVDITSSITTDIAILHVRGVTDQ